MICPWYEYLDALGNGTIMLSGTLTPEALAIVKQLEQPAMEREKIDYYDIHPSRKLSLEEAMRLKPVLFNSIKPLVDGFYDDFLVAALVSIVLEWRATCNE